MYSTIHGVGWGEVYASADYLDLLYETEGYKDARWSFIDRNYKSETEAFRFVGENYNDDGEMTGYAWYQGHFKANGSGGTVELKEKDDFVSYPLTLVNEANRAYSITYKGKTYIGYVDYEMTDSNGYLQFYIIKCSLQGGQTQVHSPVVVRLAEMYLNKAEAYVKKEQYELARQAVNMVRGRAIEGGEYDNTEFNAATAADLVVKERRLELAFEAHRTPDIYRLGHTLTRRYPGVHNQLMEVPATSPRVIQYIPQDEVNAYPGPLTQNP
ncbi:MAG: RagB/SusD family nutrient uptake outer membrane protein [Tannerellaceae bacterium]|nr:RagB/SusD family nutrient uptake outer membrane protein [Tannerellaceae bacterium]